MLNYFLVNTICFYLYYLLLLFVVFRLIFGGTVPHYFYQTVERLFKHDMKFRRFFQFLSERLIFAPFYQLVSLYFLSIFEVIEIFAANFITISC